MKYKLVIFDWDGTVMDSIARIVSSIQTSAKICQLPVPSVNEAKGIIGLSLPAAMVQLFPKNEALHSELILNYKDQYINKDTTETPLFDGVEDLLIKLQQKGYKLAIATGKGRQGLDRLLALTRLGHYFDFTQSADDAKSKPSPQMLIQILEQFQLTAKDAVMIGDTRIDMSMAQAIDMDRIGVTFGVNSKDELKVHEPVAIVDSFSDLVLHL
ncbi:HAD-IIIA family hydrolase [Pseudoalteromonas denitrificans]|uniref:Phosphoglycolate phosphatase n=1 Tax=Pseudoalteromonas denitrificans DSM 6059 TaxID=1123010 RepID=A0A1I1Q5U7_9GAMM|nr:HAD-IIIA family hydrolase [Pseudoalteromonas denitrificans]SFD17405.1 phosphoglycolate phosphatase [Pseudoalteromonas denitrificans DSM 6059]